MKSEMVYKFKGSGFNAPEEKRKYQEPDKNKKLQEAFEKWLSKDDGDSRLYRKANWLLRNINADIQEAHSLLIQHSDNERLTRAGIFLSAFYNKHPEKRIIFDVDVPLWDLGYCLAEGKTLVVLSDTGAGLGRGAKGTIINYGNTEWETGAASEGLYVSYGSSEGEFGRHAFGIAINMSERYALQTIQGTAGYLVDFAKTEKDTDRGKLAEDALRFLDPTSFLQDIKPFEIRNHTIEHMLTHKEKKMPELWDYLMQLKQTLEKARDYKKAFEMVDSFGPEPAKTIKTTIDDIFKRNGI